MGIRIPTYLGIVAAVLALCWSATAAPHVEVQPQKDSARLVVGGKLIATFRTSNGDLSAKERAELASERLEKLIAAGLRPEQVEIRDRGSSWGVYAAGGLIMLATEDEASERKTDVKSVAQLWAGNLKDGLREIAALGGKSKPAAATNHSATKSPPPAAPKPTSKTAAKPTKFTLVSSQLQIPVNETRAITWSGGTGLVTTNVDNEEVATAQLSEKGDELVVRGLTTGKAVVQIRRGAEEQSLTVWVKKYAGALGAPGMATVTGTSTPASMVRRAAQDRLLDCVTLEPGATVRITGEMTGIRPVARGRSIEVEVPVTISGDGYLPVKGSARVAVQNVELPRQEASVLLYSNDPESVREYGTLFQGLIDAQGPARLLFHHQNRMGRALTFAVHLLNPNDEPVDVQIIPGDAGPIIDTIQVGHRAAERYLSAALADIGYVIRIPARSSRPIYSARLGHLLTVSGIYGLRVVSGGSLVTLVTASAELQRPAVTDEVVAAARTEPHTYPSPKKSQKFAYVVGGTWTFIPVGRHAITGQRPNRKLFGNYGVLYDVTVDVRNPTDEAKNIQVVMSAEAGWARGVFVIDGKLIEAPQIAPPAEAVLWSFKLGPNETRTVRIQGIPVSGSAYPVSLVVRS